MNKHQLNAKLKTTGTAYLFYFLFGSHYAYLGNWGKQILYWFTVGGFLIWAIIDLFSMSSIVEKVNAPIFNQLEKIERNERDEDFQNKILMANAMNNK